MKKKALSVTLHPDNLLWLKTEVKATGSRSLSEALDEITTEARAGAGASARTIRSVVGNARIPRSDAALSEAAVKVRALFRRSVQRKGGKRLGERRRSSAWHRRHESVPDAAFVTDTYPLLFFASSDRRLSRKAAAHFAACEERSALTYVPMAVLWECSLLARKGRIELRLSFRGFFEDLATPPTSPWT